MVSNIYIALNIRSTTKNKIKGRRRRGKPARNNRKIEITNKHIHRYIVINQMNSLVSNFHDIAIVDYEKGIFFSSKPNKTLLSTGISFLFAYISV